MQLNGREGSDESAERGRSLISTITLLWPPYGIGQAIIYFALWFLSFFFLAFFLA